MKRRNLKNSSSTRAGTEREWVSRLASLPLMLGIVGLFLINQGWEPNRFSFTSPDQAPKDRCMVDTLGFCLPFLAIMAMSIWSIISNWRKRRPDSVLVACVGLVLNAGLLALLFSRAYHRYFGYF